MWETAFCLLIWPLMGVWVVSTFLLLWINAAVHSHVSVFEFPFLIIWSEGRPRFPVLLRYCLFYRLKVCGNRALSRSIGAIFPAVFAHFMSLCHISGKSRHIANFLIVVIFVMAIRSQPSFMWRLQEDTESLKAQRMLTIFRIKYFLIKVGTFF